MAAVIKQVHGIEPELVGGSDGIFEVRLDGELVYANGIACGIPRIEEVMDPLSKELLG